MALVTVAGAQNTSAGPSDRPRGPDCSALLTCAARSRVGISTPRTVLVLVVLLHRVRVYDAMTCEQCMEQCMHLIGRFVHGAVREEAAADPSEWSTWPTSLHGP